ncbi:MAG: MBL fold metallo-hydrolase [Candidatus Brocadia sp.]|nr:MAG: MBL fold metallo-hydrolase [Candidatus Brocadia sp.]
MKQLLWGDYMRVVRSSGEYYHVKIRGVEGWIKASDTQQERLLEIVFVDIGQGDGALVITPDDRKYIIDAGEGDNMYRFLRWRFGKFRQPVIFDAAIISHSDSDHYGGFEEIFKEPNVKFRAVYHNGLMERTSVRKAGILGQPKKSGAHSYITDLVPTLEALRTFLSKPSAWKDKRYPTMLNKALEAGRFEDFKMLSAGDRHFPGHGPGSTLEIQVLGPYPETVNDTLALRWLGDVGKTKNGHSIVFRFLIGGVSIFMGGDLNLESCRLLLEKHTGLSPQPKTSEDEAALVAGGQRIFGCDIAKACHHGSADLFIPFLKSIHPIATVVSSGDDEPHAHPRADALGAMGRCGRGERPLIFSTELSRSAKESIKHPNVLREQLAALLKRITDAKTDKQRALAQKKFDEATANLDRSVAVFGAINLRTDGRKVVMAYKLEQSTPSKGWDIYQMEPIGINGPLGYQSKYDK